MGRIFDADDRADDSVEGLKQLCRDFIGKHMVMVEVGCFRGVSTAVFASHAKTVHAVDPWLDRTDYLDLPREMLLTAEALFDKVIAQYPNIIKHKGLSVNVAKEFEDESLDAVYIDADHSEPEFTNDLRAWRTKVKRQGLIMGHDFGVIGHLLLVVGHPLPRATVYSDQSWLFIKGDE